MNGACVVAAMTAAIPARAYPPASAGDPREAMTCGTTAPTRPPSAAPRNIEGVKTPPGLPDDTDAMVAGLGDEKDAEEQADQLCIEDELDGLVAVAGHLRQFQGQRADHESSESAD